MGEPKKCYPLKMKYLL